MSPRSVPKSVIVSGAASGIGAAVATRLAGDGWQVIGLDLVQPDHRIDGVEYRAVDLTSEVAILSVVSSIGPVTALVHAAGLMRTSYVGDMVAADGDLMWAVHVRALGIMSRALLPHMPSGGRIVAIGSRTSAGAAGKGQYAATKAAVVGLVRSLAIELAGHGITANVISPAATATPMLTRPDRAGVAPKLPPIGRYIEPSEVASYVAFILSTEAGAITGQDLLICGGASL